MSQLPRASLSLDLDNLWSYMKTHGDPGWESFPSYFDIVVPRFLQLLAANNLKITVFVVGQDAALTKNRSALESIPRAGHEIANHSFHHEPWLHRRTRAQLATEIADAEDAIHVATGVRPSGFRGPGYSLSEDVLEVLASRGYAYDCSTFPTYVGPLARAYYFMNAGLSSKQKEEREILFGGVRDGLRPLHAYRWRLGDRRLLEIPVTTMPVLKAPFHFSYLHWLAGFSEALADRYLRLALRVCRINGIEPSLLLHPLDFMGKDDLAELTFFPGMKQTTQVKLNRMQRWLSIFAQRYNVLSMGEHARALSAMVLRERRPDFRTGRPASLGEVPGQTPA